MENTETRYKTKPDLQDDTILQENTVLGWTATFLLIALIAAALGFGGVDGTSVKLAQFIFVGALIAFVISAVAGLLQRQPKR